MTPTETQPRIPILDLGPETKEILPELMPTLERVFKGGHFILGPEVEAFEAEVAKYLGVKHAIGLNSGTDALVIALRALGVKEGDEVITPAFTFFATAEAALAVGAKPVFVDIDPASFNLDPTLLEKAITPKTKVIIPVHLFGLPCQMDAIMKIAKAHGIKVVEDVAQAFGAEYGGKKAGAIGDVGAFSFFPSKNLGAFGDGGMLTTNDAEVVRVTKMLRAHGSLKKYHNEMVGYNSRLDEVQAAILRIKLRRLDTWNEGRRKAAKTYGELLGKVPGIKTPVESPKARHVYHQYTIRSTEMPRDGLQEALKRQGIGSMVYYPVPLHKLPLLSHRRETYPHSEAAAAQVLSLPIGSSLARAHQDDVSKAIHEAVKGLKVPRAH